MSCKTCIEDFYPDADFNDANADNPPCQLCPNNGRYDLKPENQVLYDHWHQLSSFGRVYTFGGTGPIRLEALYAVAERYQLSEEAIQMILWIESYMLPKILEEQERNREEKQKQKGTGSKTG